MMLNQQSQTVNIEEFSRKLLEPEEVNGKWVSTGFGKEIGLRTQEVPEIIENAVYNNLFRLNDNYPPAEGEIGLIAREFEQY
ncbi:MAG: hypothetical protein QNJ33_04795, partial [Crocosphaera sp.]|nr:hypothetical protein [Crocosphaera sp.]